MNKLAIDNSHSAINVNGATVLQFAVPSSNHLIYLIDKVVTAQ